MFPFRQPAAVAASFPPCFASLVCKVSSLPLLPSLSLSHSQTEGLPVCSSLAWLFCWAVGPYLSSPRLLTNYFSLMTIMNKADGCCYLLKEVRGLHTTVL
jgi:hypothetical protein